MVLAKVQYRRAPRHALKSTGIIKRVQRIIATVLRFDKKLRFDFFEASVIRLLTEEQRFVSFGFHFFSIPFVFRNRFCSLRLALRFLRYCSVFVR